MAVEPEKRGESKLPDGGPINRGLPTSEDDSASSSPKDTENISEYQHGVSFRGLGEHETSMTTYPYRDGISNAHNASVVELFLLDQAHSLRVAGDIRVKVALRSNAILEGLDPNIIKRSQTCVASLKRADPKKLRWIISVDCGNVPRFVGIKAFRPKTNVTKISLMDLDLKCSCPAWRWQGAEHHSKREDYLDGKPRGTASVPVIRDPEGIKRVCKHVRAALDLIKDWTVPVK